MTRLHFYNWKIGQMRSNSSIISLCHCNMSAFFTVEILI